MNYQQFTVNLMLRGRKNTLQRFKYMYITSALVLTTNQQYVPNDKVLMMLMMIMLLLIFTDYNRSV